jgi:beta-glucosidase
MNGAGMKIVSMAWLVAAGVGAQWTAATATPDADARAATTEARMTDAERFQLLHGMMPLPLPLPGFPPLQIPPNMKFTAGYVAGKWQIQGGTFRFAIADSAEP